jgi:hypothetical protein
MTTRFAIAVIVVTALLWPPAAGAQADRPLV